MFEVPVSGLLLKEMLSIFFLETEVAPGSGCENEAAVARDAAPTSGGHFRRSLPVIVMKREEAPAALWEG